MSEKRQTESSNKEAQVAPMLELDEAMREMFGITRMEELWGLKAPALYLKVGTGDIYTDTGACCLPYAKTFTGLQDIAKRYGFAYRPGNAKCGICSTQAEYLLARTVFGAWVPWFGIRKSGEFVACGDTGTLRSGYPSRGRNLPGISLQSLWKRFANWPGSAVSSLTHRP